MPSRTFVMSYILLFCTSRHSEATLRSTTPLGDDCSRPTNFFVRRPSEVSYLVIVGLPKHRIIYQIFCDKKHHFKHGIGMAQNIIEVLRAMCKSYSITKQVNSGGSVLSTTGSWQKYRYREKSRYLSTGTLAVYHVVIS